MEAQRRYETQPNNLALNSRQLWLAHTAPFWNWCKTPWRLGASPPCHLGLKPLERIQTTQPSMVALLAEVGSEPGLALKSVCKTRYEPASAELSRGGSPVPESRELRARLRMEK